MAKITLPDLTGGFQSVAAANANNAAIETALNDQVLYRNNPDGETNTMENTLDMNSNRIINARSATAGGLIAADGDVVTFGDLAEISTTVDTSVVLLNIANATTTTTTIDGTTTVTNDGSSESYIRMGSDVLNDIVIDTQASAGWIDGTEIHFRQSGLGTTTFLTANGVSFNVPFNGTLILAGVGATVTIKKISSDNWDLIGQTSTV